MINLVEIISSLTEYGLLGVVIILLLYALNRKDKQVDTLNKRLLKRSEKDVEKYYELADALHRALNEIFELVRNRDDRRR